MCFYQRQQIILDCLGVVFDKYESVRSVTNLDLNN